MDAEPRTAETMRRDVAAALAGTEVFAFALAWRDPATDEIRSDGSMVVDRTTAAEMLTLLAHLQGSALATVSRAIELMTDGGQDGVLLAHGVMDAARGVADLVRSRQRVRMMHWEPPTDPT